MNITMARGDIKAVGFTVKLGRETQTDFDDVYFTVKKSYTDHDYKFQKRLSNGTITESSGHFTFIINPEDTNKLGFGSYDCDIEIVRLPTLKLTFPGTLTLTKETTHANNEVI